MIIHNQKIIKKSGSSYIKPVDLPFTRETWHGRMMASRGVMASMDSDIRANKKTV